MSIFDEGAHTSRVVSLSLSLSLSLYEAFEFFLRYVGDLFGAPLCCARYAELAGDLGPFRVVADPGPATGIVP
jgi:hypothetical protein